jgi:hypothetical protein
MYKGMFLLSDLAGRLLAVSLISGLNSAAGILQAIALVICFGGLIGAVIQAFSERSASGLKFGLVVAAVAGLSWAIITTFFTAGGNQTGNINPTQVN